MARSGADERPGEARGTRMPSVSRSGAWRAAVLAAALSPLAPAASADAPPVPDRHFNDYAGVVPAERARRLDQRLADFETQTSTQVLVAVYAELPSPILEDFTAEAARAWRVGREKLNNGAVLFVFVKDRKLRIEVGYGLEGALPDVTARRIIADVIVPRFRAGDYPAGLEAGVDAILAATRGEFTAPPRRRGIAWDELQGIILIVLIVLIVLSIRSGSGGGRTYTRGGWYRDSGPGIIFSSGGWGGGGGGGSSGGGGGWGGGFSGGGGDFGGGGASGSW